MITINVWQVIAWIIVGALAGSLAGIFIRHSRFGFGRFGNIIIGMVGALIGAFVFNLFNIDLGLSALAISAQDIVSAFIGSLILLLILALIRR